MGRVRGLDVIDDSRDALGLGACVTHVAATPYLAKLDPDLGELMRRFAGTQIRMAGTVGGNIANGSPIGDLPPALIALGATVALQHGEDPRTLPLENFFLAYRKQDRREGEFVRISDEEMKAAVDKKDIPLAIKLLDAILELRPDYVEAWNRRATLYYLKNDYVRSMHDIQQVLAREPRHFDRKQWSALLRRLHSAR